MPKARFWLLSVVIGILPIILIFLLIMYMMEQTHLPARRWGEHG